MNALTISHATHHLAQLNIARAREPLTHPLLADFVAAIGDVNALAEAAPGFVWRLQTEYGDATGVRWDDDDRIIVNLSVWSDLEALRSFAFNGLHGTLMRRRREWFDKIRVYSVLWWVPAGHEPTVAESRERLELLGRDGPCPEAFTFAQPFAQPSP